MCRIGVFNKVKGLEFIQRLSIIDGQSAVLFLFVVQAAAQASVGTRPGLASSQTGLAFNKKKPIDRGQ